MRGIKDFNFPAFFEAATALHRQGHEVFNPAARDIAKYGEDIGKSSTGDLGEASNKGFSLREALAADMEWICLHAQAVVLLPGWENSKGAIAESNLALALGLPLFYYHSGHETRAIDGIPLWQ